MNGQNMTSMTRESKYDVDEEELKMPENWAPDTAGTGGQVLGHLAAWQRCLGGGREGGEGCLCRKV